MVLHDANDVLMEAAKICKYCQLEDAATAIFVIFVMVWAALRLCCFPLMVIRSTLLELPVMLGNKPPMYYMFNGLLLTLFVLHCYWFTLILRIVYMKIVTGQAHDMREDEDD